MARAANKPHRLRKLVADAKTGRVYLYGLYATALRELFEWDEDAKMQFTKIMALNDNNVQKTSKKTERQMREKRKENDDFCLPRA